MAEGAEKDLRAKQHPSIIKAAVADIATFKRSGWPPVPIPLDLHIRGKDGSRSFSALAPGGTLDVFNEIVIVAPPGTGKTTTLIQFAESLVGTSRFAVFVPLAEWSVGTESILGSVALRQAFTGFNEADLMHAIQNDGGVLLLDGWNELDLDSRRRATADIKSLRRNLPRLAIVMSTRREASVGPIIGQYVEVGSLSEQQQLQIARALKGAEGEALLDHAWRTPGVRELVRIPLYLNVLMTRTTGAKLPTTKEEVLRTLTAEHEQSPEKALELSSELRSCHGVFLQALACEATQAANTVVPDAKARAIVSRTSDKLVVDGQLGTRLEPALVLDALVRHHMLVRPGQEGVSFQHQQFQEWYASLAVDELVREADHNQASAARLAAQVLNMPAWEESILFSTERLSRGDQRDKTACAKAITSAMLVDPMLAAEMIYRASEDVWLRVKAEVLAAVARWHRPGSIDRAARFMLNSGRPEFSNTLWPLITHDDDQVQLHALRSVPRFRPSIIGPDPEIRIMALPERNRRYLLSEIASHSGMDGIELATRLAMQDPSADVQRAVIEALSFRRADRFVEQILAVASDATWALIARRGLITEIANPTISARLRAEQDLLEEAGFFADLLRTVIHAGAPTAERRAEVESLVARLNVAEQKQFAKDILYEAQKMYPGEVAHGLLRRLENGQKVIFGADRLMRDHGIVVEAGAVAELITGGEEYGTEARAAASVAGPLLVGRMIDMLMTATNAVRDEVGANNQVRHKESQRLRVRIGQTPIKSVIEAALARADTNDPGAIYVLCDLLARSSYDEGTDVVPINGPLHERLVAAVQTWGRTLLTAPTATRAQMARIADVATALHSPLLVPILEQLLAEELRRWRIALEQRRQPHTRRPMDSDAYTVWTRPYQQAFAAIGNAAVEDLMKGYLRDHEFGVSAAHVLLQMWSKAHEPPRTGPRRSWPYFSDVPAKRAERKSAGGPPAATPFANVILSTASELLAPGASKEDINLALELGIIGFRMPFGERADLIASLLAVAARRSKCRLLTVLAVAGETLSADVIMAALTDILDEAKTRPYLLNENQGEVQEWLELLPFSDEPSKLLEVLDQLPKPHLYRLNLREILSALRNSPGQVVEDVIFALAERDPLMLGHYEWLAAVTQRGTYSAAVRFVDMIAADTFAVGKQRMDLGHLSRGVAELIIAHQNLRPYVYDLYDRKVRGASKKILESAIVGVTDLRGFMLLLKHYTAEGRNFDHNLGSALEKLVTERVPTNEWANAYEVHGVAAAELRATLLAMANDGSASKVAAKCLHAVDCLRDEHGIPETEPRHPDLASGLLWPIPSAL